MPYIVEPKGEKFVVLDEKTREQKGEHDTVQAAYRQASALRRAEQK